MEEMLRNPFLLTGMAILAVYRLSVLVSYDEVFRGLRARVGGLANQEYHSSLAGWLFGKLAYLVGCPFCMGLWFSLLLTALLLWGNLYGILFIWWLGLAGGQSFLLEIVLKGANDAP